MAGVGIAQIGCHRHDRGIAIGQASSGFLHAFCLKQTIDAVVEQNAEPPLNFEHAQTGLSGQFCDARCLRQVCQQQILRPQQFLAFHWVEVAGEATGVFAMFIQHQTEHHQTLSL